MEAEHSEYHYKSKSSDTVLVFIHGIQGSPLQFDYIIEKLNVQYSVENLLLPGHGKTAKDFAGSSMSEWQKYVDERVKKLQKEFSNIILVGHSMGCLLAIQTALSCPGKVRGLFLMAVPLAIRITFPYIKNGLLLAFNINQNSEIIVAARRANSISASNPVEYLNVVPRYIELLRKSGATRKLIEKLNLPIIVVQSEKDEIVDVKSLIYFEKRENVKVMTAVNAGHFYYPKESQEFIFNAFKGFVEEVALKPQ